MKTSKEAVDKHISIGDLSTKTGVNTVTLRAWERRYGLLKPSRTPKGHRLYKHTDIDFVLAVLAWLNKGFAVSQVKSLMLTHKDSKTINDIWETQKQKFLAAASTLNEQKIDAIFHQLNKQYPFETLMNHCFQPLFEYLESVNRIKADHYFLSKCLKQRLILMLLRCVKSRKKKSENTPVIAFFSLTQESSWKILLAAIWLADKGCNVDVYEGFIDIKTANECAKQLRLKLKSFTCVCFSQGRHKTIKKAVIDEYQHINYLTGADFWLHKSKFLHPQYTGIISYQPMNVAEKIYNTLKIQMENSK